MATPTDGAPRTKGVILSGMRPAGRLHLGNYLGALQNWVTLQQEFRCIYTVVDIRALTTLESPLDVAEFQPNFAEPQAKLTEAPLILGLDGQQKMGKSPDNHVEFASTPEKTSKRVLTAFTDPRRTPRDIPGRPDICNGYSLHKVFSTGGELATVYDECTTARPGCVDRKRQPAANINQYLGPLWELRREFENRPDYVKPILDDGGKRTREVARPTIGEVYEKMGPGQYV